MPNNVLTRHESACRSGHEQAQLLTHLYEQLVEDGAGPLIARLDISVRLKQLRHARDSLSAKLSELDLLQTEPDPEREELLELFNDLKHAFTADDEHAASDRLGRQESEFLEFVEEVAGHASDELMESIAVQTRGAIELLKSHTESGN